MQFFVAIHPFFFPTDLSKMQKSTFIKQKFITKLTLQE
ncbi:FIG00732223: hypothetical protein [Klebsiella pneumoniae ISC21]|nr:FIG00732223: hypothetical protein [Klebsiella pneumoniae ISC21]